MRIREIEIMAFSRRHFLGSAGRLGLAAAVIAIPGDAVDASRPDTPFVGNRVGFYGAHQAGIATPPQRFLLYGAFDLRSSDRAELQRVLQDWTSASISLTQGHPVGPVEPRNPLIAPVDPGEAVGRGPARLTLTFGLGRSLFVDVQNRDRLGLADRLPPPLISLPRLTLNEDLDEHRSLGDIGVQCCADDAQVIFHALHALARIGRPFVRLRWCQLGFAATSATGRAQETPRNLQGFKDGTNNIDTSDTAAMQQNVWVGTRDDPEWMRGGSYVVTRRIRIFLEAWDQTALSDQEATIGRHKVSGAPLGGRLEHDIARLDARSGDGIPVIPINAHIRVAAPADNDGVEILRRGYSFTDGVDATTGGLDAGLFFVAYQRDPRTQYVPLQKQLAEKDALNEYVQHVASGVFAVLPGVAPGAYLGEKLFSAG